MWTTSNVHTGTWEDNMVKCYPTEAASLISVRMSEESNLVTPSQGVVRVKMVNENVPFTAGSSLADYFGTVAGSLATATSTDAARFQGQVVENKDAGSITYFDISAGAAGDAFAQYLLLREQSAVAESMLRTDGINVTGSEEYAAEFNMRCQDGTYAAVCNGGESKSDDDDDIAIIVGSCAGAGVLAAVLGAVWFAKKEKKSDKTVETVAPPQASQPAAEPAETADPAAAAAPNDSSV